MGREDVVADPVARIANLEPRIAEPVVDRPHGGMGGDDELVERGRAAPRRGPARATGRAAGDRGCRGRGSTSPPANASPIASKKARVLASDSPSGPSRSSIVSPSRTRRFAWTAANASSNRSRIAGRRSTSHPDWAPRCRSEIRTVVAMRSNPRNSPAPAGRSPETADAIAILRVDSPREMESATSTGGPAHPTTNGTGIAVENPATGETLAHVPDLGPDDLAALVARARAAQPELVRGGLRGAGADPDGRPRLDGRQRRSGRRDDLRRDRQAGRRDDVRGALLRRCGARVLGEERADDAGRRDRRDRLAVHQRRPGAEGPLRAARRGRGDRAVELPIDQLVRRLHPGACRRQRRRPQALGGHPADLAPDGRDADRGRPARRRLHGRDRRRRDRRRPGRPRRLRHVHRLGQDGQEGDGAGRRDADPRQPRARRQGPDDRPRRRRPRAGGQRRGLERAQQRRPGLHLGRADLRRGSGPRRVRRAADRKGPIVAAGSARESSAASTSARSSSRPRSS